MTPQMTMTPHHPHPSHSPHHIDPSSHHPHLHLRATIFFRAALTPATKGLFNAAMFARMKRGAIFINVGRGESVVQDDLIAALNSGQLGGAGLDVMSPEPLPKGNPLWHAKNIIITPHISSYSELRDERQWIVLRENLRRYVAGEKMLSVVDLARGY